MTNEQLKARRLAAFPRGAAAMCDLHAQTARNAMLRDAEGREYIDFASGIAVLNTGHCHPRVVQAVRNQLDRFTHTAFQIVPYESAIALAERLNAVAPVDGSAKTAFFTTGAEAVENAVKIARAYTRRSAVIAFSGGFHGRTLMGLALTGKVGPYKVGFGPFPAEIHHALFPNLLHGISTAAALASIEGLFRTSVEPERVAAVIVEPVQGEGGFNVAPPEFLVGLRSLCDRHGILLIADEIQSGFARTGRMFAMDHHQVKPDLVTMAKSLAGGLPLSAVAGRAEVMDAPAPGGLGGTYAANPLAVAAAHAVLDVISEESLCTRAEDLGKRLTEALEQLQETHSGIAEVRGLGSMVAIEFQEPDTGAPDPARAKAVQDHAMRGGLLLLTCGTYGNVIRFLYPLTIEDTTFNRALALLRAAMD